MRGTDELQARTDALIGEAVAAAVAAESQADELERVLAIVRAGLQGWGFRGR